MTLPDLMMRTARVINRRSVLRGGAAATFTTLAAASVADSPSAMASTVDACCTGPYGTGSCGCACSGHTCYTCAGDVDCIRVTQFCPGGTGCWRSSCGRTCCDCKCAAFQTSWYCYCYG